MQRKMLSVKSHHFMSCCVSAYKKLQWLSFGHVAEHKRLLIPRLQTLQWSVSDHVQWYPNSYTNSALIATHSPHPWKSLESVALALKACDITTLERPISLFDRRDDEARGIGLCQQSLASEKRRIWKTSRRLTSGFFVYIGYLVEDQTRTPLLS